MVTYRDMSLFEYLDLKDGHGGFRTPRSRGILEQNLTALGIFGLQDPLRPGIFDSVLTCQKAGIKVIMCTGDNIDTAISISKAAGILTDE